jgi:hypothetical protein
MQFVLSKQKIATWALVSQTETNVGAELQGVEVCVHNGENLFIGLREEVLPLQRYWLLLVTAELQKILRNQKNFLHG